MNRRTFLKLLPTLPFLFVRPAVPGSATNATPKVQAAAQAGDGDTAAWAVPWAIPWEVGPSTIELTYFPVVIQD